MNVCFMCGHIYIYIYIYTYIHTHNIFYQYIQSYTFILFKRFISQENIDIICYKGNIQKIQIQILFINSIILQASLQFSQQKICLQFRRPRFSPWVRKVPQRRKQQLAPVFLPGEFPWTEEPGRLPWRCELDTTQ